MKVTSIQNFRKLYGSTDDFEKAIAYLMLQLVSALKHLQAQGIEDVSTNNDLL
jgi:hypothetical protein